MQREEEKEKKTERIGLEKKSAAAISSLGGVAHGSRPNVMDGYPLLFASSSRCANACTPPEDVVLARQWGRNGDMLRFVIPGAVSIDLLGICFSRF